MATKDLVKLSISLVTRPVARRALTRAVDDACDLKLNIGAGNVSLDGWVNTDASWSARLYLDITEPWPVARGSVLYVYGDNVIEHLPLPAGRRFLRFAFAALASGGVIRLATPDVERTARAYLHDPELTRAHLDRHRRHGLLAEHPVDMLRVTFAEWSHHAGYLYDFEALSAELTAAGFGEVVRVEAGESSRPELRRLEQRAEPTEKATELVVEASKPTP